MSKKSKTSKKKRRKVLKSHQKPTKMLLQWEIWENNAATVQKKFKERKSVKKLVARKGSKSVENLGKIMKNFKKSF